MTFAKAERKSGCVETCLDDGLGDGISIWRVVGSVIGAKQVPKVAGKKSSWRQPAS
jgi:hypothetical protein